MPHACLLFVTTLPAVDVDETKGCETSSPRSPAVHTEQTS